MTLKGRDIVDLPVVLSSSHEGVDAIEDILFDSHKRRVVGFLLKHLDISSERRVLKIEDVASFENECVLVDGEFHIKNAYEAGDVVAQIVHTKSFLSHVHAKRVDGTMLGTLTDLYFDSKSGTVEQFEVEKENSDVRYTVWECQVDNIDKNSLYIDFQKSPSFPVMKGGQASQTQNSISGADKSKNTSEEGESDNLKKEFARIISQFKKTLQSYEEEMKKTQKNHHISRNSGTSFDSQGTFFNNKNHHDGVSQISASDPHAHEAVGKYLIKNILLENDEIFAEKGDVITHQMLQDAEKKGVLVELLANSSTHLE